MITKSSNSLICCLAFLLAGTMDTGAWAQRGSLAEKHASIILGQHVAGAIGRIQRASGSVKSGMVQPVEIRAPAGTRVATLESGVVNHRQAAPATFGLHVGYAYRFELSGIQQLDPAVRLYPTVEVIGQLHPPAGKEWEYPVQVEFALEDLKLAASGSLVTRVIYLEPPDASLAIAVDDHSQPYFEVEPGADPLATADFLGRPIAIVRIGSRQLGQDLPDPGLELNSPPAEREPVPSGTIRHSPVARQEELESAPVPVPFSSPSMELIQRAHR